MNSNQWLQIFFYFAVLFILVKPLGTYMAKVYQNQPFFLEKLLGWLERLIYRVGRVDPKKEMTWKVYALAMLLFNVVGGAVLYLIQRFQAHLPLNPAGMANVTPDSSLNTAISFITNTNWQGYGGEYTMSYLTQMAGLGVHNFLSAAYGMAILVALIRGFTRKETDKIGNFWVDLTRSTLYILLPLSLLLAVGLISQGMPQTFSKYQTASLVQPTSYEQAAKDAQGNPVTVDGKQKMETVAVTEQTLALGPVASQIAIKQLGTNGGGYYNVNSAHPYENPTPLANFLEMLSILLIGSALCYTFGLMVGDKRQGWALWTAMFLLLAPMLYLAASQEQSGNPALTKLTAGVNGETRQDGNMEGKETRFGTVNSAIWASVTTAASNGSVNSMHDSNTPLGGLVPLWMMMLGEVAFGGVGSGLYGMLAFVIVAVFVAGLMVGRTPEYLGKKIQAYEMKMASIAILIPPLLVLIFTAIALMSASGRATIYNPGAHGFSEVLYLFVSQSNNNGSAFAGIGANNPFYNSLGAICMFIARFWLAIPILAIAGSLAKKKIVPAGAGTLPTHTPLFIVMLVSTVVIVGALSFIPALSLGPIIEHLRMALP